MVSVKKTTKPRPNYTLPHVPYHYYKVTWSKGPLPEGQDPKHQHYHNKPYHTTPYHTSEVAWSEGTLQEGQDPEH